MTVRIKRIIREEKHSSQYIVDVDGEEQDWWIDDRMISIIRKGDFERVVYWKALQEEVVRKELSAFRYSREELERDLYEDGLQPYMQTLIFKFLRPIGCGS